MTNKTYDILKWIALVVLPAIATLYSVVANIWGWSYSYEISATITAINTALGSILGISSVNYYKKRG